MKGCLIYEDFLGNVIIDYDVAWEYKVNDPNEAARVYRLYEENKKKYGQVPVCFELDSSGELDCSSIELDLEAVEKLKPKKEAEA